MHTECLSETVREYNNELNSKPITNHRIILSFLMGFGGVLKAVPSTQGSPARYRFSSTRIASSFSVGANQRVEFGAQDGVLDILTETAPLTKLRRFRDPEPTSRAPVVITVNCAELH